MDKVSHQAGAAVEEKGGEGRGGETRNHFMIFYSNILRPAGAHRLTMMQVQFSLEEMHFTKILCILAPFLDNLVEDITIEILHFIHSHQFWCDC